MIALNISLVLVTHHVRLLRAGPNTATHSVHPRIFSLRWILLLVIDVGVLYLHVIWCPVKFTALRTALLVLKIV